MIKWIPIKDALPDLGVEVLCFYKIQDFDYFCVGKIYMVSSQTTGTAGNYKEFKSIEWKDTAGDVITPTHWFPLKPPN